MEKDMILKTAVTQPSEDGDGFDTVSPLAPTIVGWGETPADSFNEFREHLDLNYPSYEKGEHAVYKKTPGRPRKENQVALNTTIDKGIKEEIKFSAKKLKMSQGQYIECAVKAFNTVMSGSIRGDVSAPKRRTSTRKKA